MIYEVGCCSQNELKTDPPIRRLLLSQKNQSSLFKIQTPTPLVAIIGLDKPLPNEHVWTVDAK